MLPDHFQTLSDLMAAESRAFGEFYKAHRGKLGENREWLLRRFLSRYLPKRYGVGTGFVLLADELSTQQDVVIYDAIDHPVLFAESAAPVFPPHALRVAVEVKSKLDKHGLQETVRKTKILKQSLRKISQQYEQPLCIEPLIGLFAFESEPLKKLGNDLGELQEDIDCNDRLDLVAVLDHGVIVGGGYWTTVKVGQNGSEFAKQLGEKERNRRLKANPKRLEGYQLSGNTLLAWYYWLLRFLSEHGPTKPELLSVISSDHVWGDRVF